MDRTRISFNCQNAWEWNVTIFSLQNEMYLTGANYFFGQLKWPASNARTQEGVNWNVRISSFPVFLLNSEIVVYFEQKNVRNRFRMLALTKTKLKHNCKPFNLMRFYTFCNFQQITITKTMSWLRGNIYLYLFNTVRKPKFWSDLSNILNRTKPLLHPGPTYSNWTLHFGVIWPVFPFFWFEPFLLKLIRTSSCWRDDYFSLK